MEDTENYINQDALKILGILKDMRKENIMQQKDMKLADIHLNQLRKRSEKVEAKTLRNILHDIMYEDAEIQQKIILMENTLKENDALQKAEKTMQYLGKALTNQRTGTGTGTIIECYMVLTLKILIMITAIMLISASVHISKVKPCELKTALDDISLEYSPHPCKFNSIKDTSSLTLISGIAVVVLNLCLLFVPVCIYLKKYDEEPFSSWISYFAATISVSLVAFIVMMVIYNSVAEKEEEETTLNFLQLESKMLSWLHKTYKSDNTSNGEAVSIQWNVFFIKYDCCGVSEVTGTTNDFDNTPWCTTSGSCQSTASQIPRTCCKSVSLSDYYSAPSSCHASVNDGTYKPSCISRMKALSRDNINEFQLGMLSLSSLTLGMLQAMEFILAIIFEIACLRRKNEKNKTVIQQLQT